MLKHFISMTVTELNEDKHYQICNLLEKIPQIEKLKNNDIRIFLDNIVRQNGAKAVRK